MHLPQTQCRHVCGLWNSRSPCDGEDGPRGLCLRKALGTRRSRLLTTPGWILRLGLSITEPPLWPRLIPQTQEMKHLVFDNWFLMAVATLDAIRIRALDSLPLLISGKDFVRAAFSAHSPARRP